MFSKGEYLDIALVYCDSGKLGWLSGLGLRVQRRLRRGYRGRLFRLSPSHLFTTVDAVNFHSIALPLARIETA